MLERGSREAPNGAKPDEARIRQRTHPNVERARNCANDSGCDEEFAESSTTAVGVGTTDHSGKVSFSFEVPGSEFMTHFFVENRRGP